MSKCLNSKSGKIDFYIVLMGFIALIMVFGWITVCFSFGIIQMLTFCTVNIDWTIVPLCIFTCLFATITVAWGYFAFWYYDIYSREFIMDENGISIYYFSRKVSVHPWEHIVDICVCDVDHRKPQKFDMIIRLSLYTEVNGPLTEKRKDFSGVDMWRNGMYLMMHHNDVIYLDYSIEMCKKIEALSQKPVLDRRTTLGKTYKVDFFDFD